MGASFLGASQGRCEGSPITSGSLTCAGPWRSGHSVGRPSGRVCLGCQGTGWQWDWSLVSHWLPWSLVFSFWALLRARQVQSQKTKAGQIQQSPWSWKANKTGSEEKQTATRNVQQCPFDTISWAGGALTGDLMWTTYHASSSIYDICISVHMSNVRVVSMNP